MAGPPKVELSDRGARQLDSLEARLERAEAQLEDARREWAELVRHLGIAAVARRKGIARQTLTERVQRYEA